MFQSWLKRQIILAAILVPLASIIFIISALIIKQISQQQAIVLNVSLLITLIILFAIFIRLYQINFFAINNGNVIGKFWEFSRKNNLQRFSIEWILTILKIAIIIVSFPSHFFYIVLAIFIADLAQFTIIRERFNKLLDETRKKQLDGSDEPR